MSYRIALPLLLMTCFSVISCQNSISQISPRSSLISEDLRHKIKPSETIKNTLSSNGETKTTPSEVVFEKETLRDVNDIETNNIDIIQSSGRYHITLSPTVTHEKINILDDYTTEDNFLLKGGRQARSSRPQIQEMNTVIPVRNVNSDFVVPRQNGADIQGIISGIVKILNGNVNVHTNNQGTRKPPLNRINNRGPPRISEAQIPTGEVQEPNYNHQSTFSEAPLIRPFINGVPIPEQIVPSMQQSYRPGFISQNRPPWKRTKPPISRRPIPQYTHYHIPTNFVPENQPLNFNISKNNSSSIDISQDLHDDTTSEESTLLQTIIDDHKENSNFILKDSPSKVLTIIHSTSEVNTIENLNDSETIIPSETSSIMEIESSNLEIVSDVPVTYTPTETLSSRDDLRTTTILKSSTIKSITEIISTHLNMSNEYKTSYIPRPGVVLDDPEFISASKNQNQMYKYPNLPAGYGEIFDVTLSAVQFGDSNVGSHQTINIKPYGMFDGTDIILTPSGDQGFVSIDGKRTFLNLFEESTKELSININNTKFIPENNVIETTKVFKQDIRGSGYAAVADPEAYIKKSQHFTQHYNQNRLVLKPKLTTQLPPIRIDTCIVGDDSTCDNAQNEKCRTENGVSSCNCRQGYARRKHRDICRKIVSFVVSMRIDRYNEKKILWEPSLDDSSSESHRSLKHESLRAVESAMSMTPFSDEFLEATVNNIYQGDASKGLPGVFVNLTLMIEENAETLRSSIKNDIQRHLMGVLHRRNNNIGTSALFVESVAGSISAVVDLNECENSDLNDCHPNAICINIWGSYRCQCNNGMKDPFIDQPRKTGRECMSCDSTFCNNRGTCSYENGNQVCTCIGFYYGTSCEIDGEVLFVSIGASVAAIIIIILTLICLVMWSRKWQREHKNAVIGSPLFGLGGYMGNGQMKSPIIGTMPYQMTLEDRMRWAQIADVMAQSNHYAAEPSRTIRTIYSGYPNLNGMIGGMTLSHNTHHNNLPPPPVPLPRLGIRSNGLRTLENSSSSEEEDRTDLLGRNFQVPRPKSRTASVTSAIYYDVDFTPEKQEYGGGTSGIPLSTYEQNKKFCCYMCDAHLPKN